MLAARVPGALHAAAIRVFLLGIAVFTLVALLRAAGGFESLELLAWDHSLRWRAPAPPDPRIVVVEETEEDIRRFGYPLADGVFAQVLDQIAAAAPRAIGVDKYRDIPVPPGSAALAQTLRANPNIFWVMNFGESRGRRIPPPAILQGTERIGFNDFIDDAGGVIRRGLLFMDDDGVSAYGFGLRLALAYLKPMNIGLAPDSGNPEHARLGAATIKPFERDDGGYVGADARGYQFLLDYQGMPRRFRSFTVGDILDGRFSAADLRERIVIIGSSAPSLRDDFYTPFSRGQVQDQRLPGPHLHGMVASQLLRIALGESRPLRVWPDPLEYAWIGAWCALGILLGTRAGSMPRFVALTAAALALVTASGQAAAAAGWWIPLLPAAASFALAAAAAIAYRTMQEKLERSALMDIFSRHVSPQVADSLWQQRAEFLEGGRPRPQQITATVLFTDIRGFTKISEKLDATSLFAWLDQYLDAMSRIVDAHGGIVNKYIGDAVMAVFGVPVARDNAADIAHDATQAVACALAMGAELERLNRQWRSAGLPEIGIRAGIHCGPLVAGSVGGAERLEYTVIGDTVNIASRLESYGTATAADGTCRILASEATLARVGPAFEARPIGSVALKGKAEEIAIFQITGHAGPVISGTEAASPSAAK